MGSPRVISPVELILSDTRVWARSATRSWDQPPSVAPSSGFGLVAGGPLQVPAPDVSVVRLITADRIAFSPELPTITDAVARVFDSVFENLRVPCPDERVTVVCPTEWGARRRAVVEAASRRCADEVVFDTVAIRAARQTALSREPTAVVEFGQLSTTVSSVVRNREQSWIEACEYEPNIGVDDIRTGGQWHEQIFALLARALDGQRPASVVTVGISDPALLEEIRVEVAGQYGDSVGVQAVSGSDLVGIEPEPTPETRSRATIPSLDSEWVGSLRQRAAATRSNDGRGPIITVVVLAAVVAVVAACVVLIQVIRSDDSSVDASTPSTAVPATSVPLSTVSASPSVPRPDDTALTLGPATVNVPQGWRRQSDGSGGTRAVLVPDSDIPARITVTYNTLAQGAGYDEVVGDIGAKIARADPGRFRNLERDVVFAGRPGIGYEERPGDESVVRWHVTVDRGVQVSVGCQYGRGRWGSIETACEDVVRSLVVVA